MQFKEVKKLDQWIMWFVRGLSILMILFFLWGYYQQVILGKPFGSNPGPDWMFPAILIFQAGFWYLFENMQLKTEIDGSGVRMSFYPFAKKDIPLSSIQKAEIIDYGFVGGWGIRMGSKYGTVYNAQGKMGLWLRLKDGSKFVIGTQQKKEMQKVLDHYSI